MPPLPFVLLKFGSLARTLTPGGFGREMVRGWRPRDLGLTPNSRLQSELFEVLTCGLAALAAGFFAAAFATGFFAAAFAAGFAAPLPAGFFASAFGFAAPFLPELKSTATVAPTVAPAISGRAKPFDDDAEGIATGTATGAEGKVEACSKP